MPRKKIAKHSAKRQASNNSFATIRQMEKDFSDSPTILAVYISKEIASTKQKQNKIKSSHQKASQQVKATAARVQASAGKKSAKAAKKAHSAALKAQSTLHKELNDITKTIATLSDKHAKMIAIRKHVSQFDKDWAKKLKADAAKAKAKINAKAKPKAKAKSAAKPSAKPTYEQPKVDSDDQDTLDSFTTSDTPEFTS